MLAIRPTADKPLLQTTITGGLLGAMCYATYDLTNQATLKVWSTQITVMDVMWGTFLTGACATVGGRRRLRRRRSGTCPTSRPSP